MRVLGEHVEDRQLVLGRKPFQLGVGVRAHPDRGDVATQDARGVTQRLAAAELGLAGAQDHGMAAHLDDARLEAHARPGARLLEDERDRAALQDVLLDRGASFSAAARSRIACRSSEVSSVPVSRWRMGERGIIRPR